MWFWIILIVVILVIIFRKKDKNDSNLENESSVNKASIGSKDTVVDTPVDPQKYVIDTGGHRLVHYNGDENEDILFIPLGISIVGNDESQIQEGKKWDIVYIPRSVHTIHDLALPFVEAIYYEGSAEEFKKINVGAMSNFTTGFIPNFAKDMAPEFLEHAKVKEVRFHFNEDLPGLYAALAEKRKEKRF